MNADTLTMLCREGDVEANDSFQRQFSPPCIFQTVVWKFVASARSLVRNIFIFEVLVSFCVANAALVALSFSGCCRGRASFSAHFWTSGTNFYVYYVGTATIRTIGRRVESVFGCKQVFSVLMDAAVLTYTCLRPSVVVKYNQLYSEMRNVSACFL